MRMSTGARNVRSGLMIEVAAIGVEVMALLPEQAGFELKEPLFG